MDNIFISQIYDILNKGKLSHAVLIESGDESERIKTAIQVAQAIVCSSDNKPCDMCSDCKKAMATVHPDITVYEGGTTVGSFKVDFIREIIKDSSILPNEAERKVYILNRADTMSVSAQNALLKILEEPPRYVNFILLSHSKSSMLPTILSRVTVYSLNEEENIVDEEISRANLTAKNILTAVINNNELELLKLTAEFEKDRNFLTLCCRELYKICSLSLIAKLTDNNRDFDEFSMALTKNKFSEIADTCNYIINASNANMNGNLLATLFCSKLIS